jgi:CheY-like chemotaxis protein
MKFERSIGRAGLTSFDSVAAAMVWLDGERGPMTGGTEDDADPGLGINLTRLDADASVADAAPDAAFVASPLIEGRILYVEDNFRIAEVTEMMLDDLGLTVVWAACAEDALKIIDDTVAPFDLVLTDVVMPGLSGVQLARRISRHWPDVPIVLTSGFSEELAQGYGSEYELLQKPFTRLALIECLQRYLRSRSS